MRIFNNNKLGNTVVICLDRGELFLESVEQKLKELGIKNAIVSSCVGSIGKLVFHHPTSFSLAAEDVFKTVIEPMEISSMIGSVIDGAAHFHFVASGPNGLYGGHIEYGTEVLYLVEIMFTEIEGLNVTRKMTPEKVKKLFPAE